MTDQNLSELKWDRILGKIASALNDDSFNIDELSDMFFDAFGKYIATVNVDLNDEASIDILQVYTDIIWPTFDLWYEMPRNEILALKAQKLEMFIDSLKPSYKSVPYLRAFEEAKKRSFSFFKLPEVERILYLVKIESKRKS